MPAPSQSLIAELEIAVRSGSPEARVAKLREVTDLFLQGADQLNEEQVKVFDDVLCRLSAKIEERVLAELSTRLAPIDNAPLETVRRLAHDASIRVAGPVLRESKRLTTVDLAEIARLQGQPHLLAIATRAGLEIPVTDVLAQRGEREVLRTLADNASARLSELGFGLLVQKTANDEVLCEKVGLRPDVPLRLLRDLLTRATEAVRTKLLTKAPAGTREELSRILARTSGAARGVDRDGEEGLVKVMWSEGRLNEAAIYDFARRGRFAEVIAGLTLLCSSKKEVISELVMGARNDAVLVPCKAARLSWTTVEAILRHRHGDCPVPEEIIELARNDFHRLTVAVAQKTLRFFQVRAAVAPGQPAGSDTDGAPAAIAERA